MNKTNYRSLFLGLIVVSLIFRVYIISIHAWPINGDEAQYWSWAKHLAWGYYSKPPMVAWVIAVTTHFFGNGAIGLRIGTPIAYAITSIFLYAAAKKLFDEQTGFWTGIIFLFIPGVTFSSSIISTDPFLLLFWSIAFWGLLHALKTNQSGWWIFTGVALGFSFYSKYAAILFTISLFLYLLISKPHHHLLKNSGPYIVLILPFVLLIPNLLWNYQNHFASIVAVKNNADLSSNLFHFGNLLNFVGSQFAVFGPVLFITLLVFIYRIRDFIKDERFLLLSVFTFVTLLIMTIESFLSRAHANWSAPAYLAATILVVAVLLIERRKFWLWFALVLHFIFAVGFANFQPIIRFVHAPMDRKMTIISWPSAVKSIHELQQKYPEANILVDRRMLLTQIMYFAKIPLSKMFAWNPSGEIKSQYDLVTHMQGQKGNNFLLFAYNPNPQSIFKYFKSVQTQPTIVLMTIDGHPLPMCVFYLQDFQGY